MGLEEFEHELAQSKSRDSKEHRSHRSRDEDGERRHHHRHHHRSHRHRDDEKDEERRHRHKRHRDRDDDSERRHRKRHRSDSPKSEKEEPEKELKVFDSDDEDDWVEKEAAAAPPEENILDQRDQDLKETKVQRDAWMQEPSELDIDYVQSRKPEAPASQFVGAKDNNEFKIHENNVNQHLADLQNDFDSDGEDEGGEAVKDGPAQHEVSYTFGDSGSSWRMTKLKAVYRQAEESGKSVEDVAIERYGDLRDFDEAREEEREMDRRKMYGKDYVGLEKPSGELFQERKMKAGIRREAEESQEQAFAAPTQQGESMAEVEPPAKTAPLDATALNRLKAQMMKAKLRGAANAAQLEEEFNAAEAASLANRAQSDVVVLSNMENRMLAGDRSGEVTAVSGKRGRERGLVVENEDMSIEDMVKQEKRTRGVNGGEGKAFAERIAKDSKFINDLDYMDDNASKLSKKVIKSETNLRNTAIGDFQKMQKILENCPLCYHEESNQPPAAPVISLATRTYMTLATEPELSKYSAVIVPLQHRLNLLECDDDEWEEIRNFMKSLTRFYHAQDKSVIFYENAAFMGSRKGHAALNAIPLPHHLAENAPAYFKEAILASDEQWSQHKPIIDTLALVQKPGYGKAAFRKAMVKEMPYFHVFYTLDGGMGHVIEDERRWPKGDLFAREVIGGMLDRGPETIKKQGRWEKHDRRLESFRKKWDKFDWTKVLMDAQ
ncbi:hypothetical protein M409DRAFT_52389 [Zasmidium cellare ATCC 36951]|uniref:Cwf19-like C-terminal domain-containing protein n=1 Tax=Zasmidium cellare ATCC 36951 TaxID=1080233 RepID=A0A6A6CUP6_ZASCE|nr:uncharacterized protein M409DRAFT_52389 [Zasmidium cellare ATCC 36951]KAF2169910.1 hypothetical protein M409DRAFT_52389 [Zasmidium cellare ATCC 36951]